jgi:hypothetical protein
VDCLSNILSDTSRLRDADDTIFALVSLNPKHKWVNEWITNLTEQPPDRNKLAQAAAVAANLMQSLERRSSWPFHNIEDEELEQAADFAATVASLIISKDGRFLILNGPRRLAIYFPWHRGFDNVVIKDSLFFEAGMEVVSKLCRQLVGKEGIAGITKFVKETTDNRYGLEARLDYPSNIKVDVRGKLCEITNCNARFSCLKQGQDILSVSWETNEGMKRGVVKSINVPNDARFSLNVRGMGNVIDDDI